MKPNAVVLAVLVLAIMGAGFWVLITPRNSLTNLFRGQISDIDSRVTVGPYPLEEDFKRLRRAEVTTVVSLLDPRLPYERVLLDREQELARKYGMRFQSFPMVWMLGYRVSEDYARNAAAAAEAIAGASGKVYLHCYLGIHRVQTVKDLLLAKGAPAGTYVARKAERSAQALLMDRAQAAYNQGRFNVALEMLLQSGASDPPGRLLAAWSHYRLGNMVAARVLFEEVARAAPRMTDAQNGLGYCALRENDLASAAQYFGAALQANPKDPASLTGMGLVRFRQEALDQAAGYLDSALQIDPSNAEARQVLERIRAGVKARRN